MSKREKVILVLMSIVVVFGVYNFLFSSPTKKTTSNPLGGTADINTFIADVGKSLQGDHSEANTYILKKAREEWTRDPFWNIERPKEREVVFERITAPKAQAEHIYSGYLKMGEQKLAIIDGVEYEPGDELRRGGPVVKSIDPKQVIIEPPGGGDNIILPLKEIK